MITTGSIRKRTRTNGSHYWQIVVELPKSKTFPEFFIFDLCELSREDSNAYLSSQGIVIDEFWKAASTNGIAGMLDNAFYLVKVCELYAFYGVGFIKSRVLPTATGSFLNDIASICEDMPVDSLRPKFEAEYSTNPTDGLQARLITYGSDAALRDYVDEVKKNRQNRDEDAYPSTPTQAIKTIREPRFLPLLGELIPIVCDPEFVDEDFMGLYNSLSEALVNCGKVEQQVTIEMVENARLQLSGQERAERFCNYVIEEIKRNARRDNDQPMRLEQVRIIISV